MQQEQLIEQEQYIQQQQFTQPSYVGAISEDYMNVLPEEQNAINTAHYNDYREYTREYVDCKIGYDRKRKYYSVWIKNKWMPIKKFKTDMEIELRNMNDELRKKKQNIENSRIILDITPSKLKEVKLKKNRKK
jgi:hypothetical protein